MFVYRTVTPTSIHLKQFNARGIKWFAETQQDLAWIPAQWPQLNELAIDSLAINNLQLIQLINKPFWQLSGLTIEGSDTQLVKTLSGACGTENYLSVLIAQALESLSALKVSLKCTVITVNGNSTEPLFRLKRLSRNKR